jgi:decaprenylphospho-beta-D-erythro-pentofuranosid-2-ulose 2-reductase
MGYTILALQLDYKCYEKTMTTQNESRSVLILGASSAIARGAANAFAERKMPLFLAGRDLDELERIANDLTIRYGITVKHGYFDAEQLDTHESFFKNAVQEMASIEGVLLAFGYLSSGSVFDKNECAKVIQCNFSGAVSILNLCAQYFIERKRGFIIGISSVAGDRGRNSYIYGAAKSAVSVYLQGLRRRLFHDGIRVITIKPGFVDTPMTYGLKGMFLVADPKIIGKQIVNTLDKSVDVVYLPWFWRYIMWIIKSIPEQLFKRLSI